MDLRGVFYVLIALIYIGYPLYYLMTQPNEGKTRVMGLGLMAYGLIGLFWSEAGGMTMVCIGALMAVLGFGVYFRIVEECFLWLLFMGYALIMMAWPETVDPIFKFAGALVLAIGFEHCMSIVRARASREAEEEDEMPLGQLHHG